MRGQKDLKTIKKGVYKLENKLKEKLGTKLFKTVK